MWFKDGPYNAPDVVIDHTPYETREWVTAHYDGFVFFSGMVTGAASLVVLFMVWLVVFSLIW